MAEPSTPGGYVGEHRNGYFWNGTSWDQAETQGGTAAPSTAFGGTIINQQKPAAAPASSASAAAKRASILATIMRIESGGKNIPQSIDDINMRNGDPAQGFYQITGGTWREYGGDKTGHKSALDAPYATQLQIAQNIPVERWGAATQQALRAAGYDFNPGETLGQLLARHGEDPTATRPEDVGGSSVGGAPPTSTPYVPPAGLLAQAPDAAALLAAQQAAAKTKEEDEQTKAAKEMMTTGIGLLGKTQTQQGAPFLQPAPIHRPQVQPTEMPDFTTMLAQQRLKQRGLV